MAKIRQHQTHLPLSISSYSSTFDESVLAPIFHHFPFPHCFLKTNLFLPTSSGSLLSSGPHPFQKRDFDSDIVVRRRRHDVDLKGSRFIVESFLDFAESRLRRRVPVLDGERAEVHAAPETETRMAEKRLS